VDRGSTTTATDNVYGFVTVVGETVSIYILFMFTTLITILIVLIMFSGLNNIYFFLSMF
jgi:hypothetical protein